MECSECELIVARGSNRGKRLTGVLGLDHGSAEDQPPGYLAEGSERSGPGICCTSLMYLMPGMYQLKGLA
jgi:hypothetical protein